MTKTVLLLLLLSSAMGPAVARAQVVDQNACILQSMRGVQSNVAVAYINEACNFLSTMSASMELNRSTRLYYQCMIQSLTGVQNDQAAVLVQQACRQQYP
jgi:hypothetical protein